MTGPDSETLTAALRRLADERASGLLSVATPGRDVLVELTDGTPVAIGPIHDVTSRIGPDAHDALGPVAVVDELVDRTVQAIVGGDGDWTWDVSSDADRLPVPPGLVEELARRAVDAAQAMAVIDPAEILTPGHEVETSGELGRVRELFDGERTVEEVAAAADLTIPAVATMAAAMVAAGALSAADRDDEAEPVSWTDAVRATEEDDDDEPELWVMEPSEDDEFDDEADEDASATDQEPDDGATRPATFRPVVAQASSIAEEPAVDDEQPVATPDDIDDAPESIDDAPESIDDAPESIDDAPESIDDAPESIDDAPEPIDDAPEPIAVAPAAAASAEGPAPADGWNDTTWLDELSPQDRHDDSPPVLAAGDDGMDDPRAALSSMLNDLQQEDPASAGGEGEEQASPATAADEPGAGAAKDVGTERKEPKAEPGEVAEFLRELSRLALDDD